jgi:hypothetical protein
MKTKIVTIMVVALVAISLGLPATSLAWGYRGGWHGGWYGPGAFAGGLLLGAAIADPWYAPYPVYAYPAPQVVYAAPPVYAPSQAYAYPDPTVSAPQAQNETPSGQWVVVPGQSVNGTWVPQHKVWVPNTH